jgi:flavin-dependent dehydrogenase
VTGVEFKSDRWQVNTANGPVEGRYIIAADGAKGPMAKWLGFKEPKQRSAGSIEVQSATAASKPMIYFDFGQVKNGYIWNMPKADGYSVSLGAFKGGDGQDLKKIGAEYAKKFGLDLTTSQQYEHAQCLWDGNQKLHVQNAVLTGDAASVADPLSGEGIRPSMFSGMKAAEAVDKSLAGEGNALENYTQVMSEEWGTDMGWAQRLAGPFFSFPKVGYKVGVKRPIATQLMLKILFGELRYSEVVNHALKRMTNPFA